MASTASAILLFPLLQQSVIVFPLGESCPHNICFSITLVIEQQSVTHSKEIQKVANDMSCQFRPENVNYFEPHHKTNRNICFFPPGIDSHF